jgi:hypothetical protein
MRTQKTCLLLRFLNKNTKPCFSTFFYTPYNARKLFAQKI